jgi:AraC family transcriptional regulator
MNPPFPIGQDLCCDGVRLRTVRYAPGAVQPPHEHPSASATLIIRGRLLERVGSREETAGPLSVVVKPAGVRHANRFGSEGASALQILFDPGATREHEEDSALREWRWIHGGVASRPFLALLASLRRHEAGDSEGIDVESLLYDALAALTRTDPSPRTTRSGRVGCPPPWLARVRERLAGDPEARLRVRDLARDAGVHPVSLARAFRRHYGVSVTTAMRLRRISLAAGQLGDGEERLCDVALGSGFADQAHLCRVFKSSTGLTPLGYRRLVRA